MRLAVGYLSTLLKQLVAKRQVVQQVKSDYQVRVTYYNGQVAYSEI